MAIAFPYLSILINLLFFTPILCFSCPSYHLQCSDTTIIDINYPFYTNNSSPECRGTHLISCYGSTPVFRFRDQYYTVVKISYTEKLFIIQDTVISIYLHGSHCSFLYTFTEPIRHFNLSFSLQRPFLNLNDSFFRCTWDDYDFSSSFLSKAYNFTLCKEYNLYYRNELENGLSSANCSTTDPPLFEWILSFGDHDGRLAILSIGYSRQFELRRDCFDCLVTAGKNCNSSANRCPRIKGKNEAARIALGFSIGLGSFILALFLLILCVCQHTKICNYVTNLWNKNLNSDQNIEELLKEYGSMRLKRYTYSDVKKITKFFHEKLGQGGYGTVFKGGLEDGQLVAVKVLSESKGNGEEFVNEVASISRTSHVNIVSLSGFCLEGSKRALIYDFMCNGSLEKFIYSEKAKTTLDWERIYRIAIGTARGLDYLHCRCNTKIVHFDIKPHNILLDQDFCPKISDFGLAKLCQQKGSILSMADARGTIGYIAPEVFSRNFGVVSSKSDVYSYGMMVLEMAGGTKNTNMDAANSSEMYFPYWIYKQLDQKENLRAYVEMPDAEEIARKIILVGLWCIQTKPHDRPSMSRVIKMLEGSINDLQVPPKPYFSSPLDSSTGTSPIHDGYSDNCSFSYDSQ